jgi:predicted dehydrogenase
MTKWGIIGTGNIAHQFARGLRYAPDAQLIAVGSRSQASADRFGDEFDVPKRYPTYEALLDDPDVQAIYISTPHPFHYENTMMCLDAGKHVLCEKPFAMNAAQARQMIRAARHKRLFLMEAMWTRFIPAMVKVRELIAAGTIGEPRMLTADFGYRAPFDPKHRLFAPELGGGALLDVGVYPVALASMLWGTPENISAQAHLGETRVDEQIALIFKYRDGQLAQLAAATRTQTPQEAWIMGTEGAIHIAPEWWHPTGFTLIKPGREPERFDLPYEGTGYQFEAIEVGWALRAGELESRIMPLDESLEIIQMMDQARAQIGLTYPNEDV